MAEIECCGIPKILFDRYFGERMPRNGVEIGPYLIKPREDYPVIASGSEKRMAQVREIAHHEMGD